MVTGLSERVILSGNFHEDRAYPAMLVNVTNRCNLSCRHCFVFRDANPNEPSSPRLELSDDDLLHVIEALRDRHKVHTMLWMGGEPLLRRRLIQRGTELFERNHVVTNGTVPLVDLGPDTIYIVSLDGPPETNDMLRGEGVFRRVMDNILRVPDDFTTPIQAQCTVTRANQDSLAELVDLLVDSRFDWMTFTFYVPRADDRSDLAWQSLEDRMPAVEEVRRLKEKYPAFVRNGSHALDLMAPDQAPAVTASCPAKVTVLPLYLDGDRLVTPFCCYGNDVDCDGCGSWFVFTAASAISRGSPPGGRGTWDRSLPDVPTRGRRECPESALPSPYGEHRA